MGQDLSKTRVVLCAIFLIRFLAPQDMRESGYMYSADLSLFIILLERGKRRRKASE
jgi:hypothetical protein